ncbi:MAG: GNAT family N-acetyltransferase [Lachnospiraceae bacterium]|nr:GNAT family N-acetyltransferase [Lachnospiraceae bacterium]
MTRYFTSEKEGNMIEIKDCVDYEVAKKLIREYSEIKGAESCFVSLDKELADLGTYYKDGALLIGFENGNPIATIAIKRIDKDTCEAKRLYIKPEYRGKGYARNLMNKMLDRSRELGFKEVTFTTKPEVMRVGYGLYQRMGFEEVNFADGVASMRMIL